MLSAWMGSELWSCSKPLPRARRTSVRTCAARKMVHLIRHGQTEMNVYLTNNSYYSKSFKDPLIYDTRLTAAGESGATKAASKIAKLNPAPQLVVASPLTRALRTAQLMFEGSGTPIHVEPLARERVYLSSDIGRGPEHLAAEFPGYSFDHLPSIWWYTGGREDPLSVVLEPQDVFGPRMLELLDWLAARPESSIALVCHWGVIYALTGEEFENCQVKSYELEALTRRRSVVMVD